MFGAQTQFLLPSTLGRRSLPIEYFVLANTRSEGPVVGHLAGQPIHETIVDAWGIRYHYAGLASRDADGRFVRPGGFIYVSEDQSAKR